MRIIFLSLGANAEHGVQCDNCGSFIGFTDSEVPYLYDKVELPQIECPNCRHIILLTDELEKLQ